MLRVDLENEVMEHESAIIVCEHDEAPRGRLCPAVESQVAYLNGPHLDLKVEFEVPGDLRRGFIRQHEVDGAVCAREH